LAIVTRSATTIEKSVDVHCALSSLSSTRAPPSITTMGTAESEAAKRREKLKEKKARQKQHKHQLR